MKRMHIILLLIGLGLTVRIRAQVEALDTLVSLITCDPGSDLYSLYGHSAIRLKHADRDIIFNYGTFDTRQSGFYFKFMRGKLLYQLSIAEYSDFLLEYHMDKRGVVEQEILLKGEDKKHLVDFLYHNALPQNRDYAYDFFYDNCATRIRDALQKAHPQATFPNYTDNAVLTYRDLLHQYETGSPWIRYGIDLIIGSKADKVADVSAQMYLPDYLKNHLANTKLIDGPLLGSTFEVLIFDREKQDRRKAHFFTPALCLIVCSMILLILYYSKKYKSLQTVLNTIYILMAIAGVVIVLLWFFTDHKATKANYNLLWIHPFYLLLPFVNKALKSKAVVLFTALTALVGVAMAGHLIPQSHPSFYMAALLILVGVLQWLMINKIQYSTKFSVNSKDINQ